jgi:HAD superfamily hydrolase (TIGR01509 family)
MTIQAVLWDIDGTLVDSEPLHLDSLLAVCEHFNVDISDLPDDRFIGVNLNGVWDVLKPRFPAQLDLEVWKRMIDEHYAQHTAGLRVMPGAIETISRLQELGVRQAAVSNSGRSVVDTNLGFLDIRKILEFSISLDDVRKPKPDPQPYQQALNTMKLDATQAVAVEDSNAGARSARSAGLKLVAYNNPDLPADASIADLTDLLEILPQLQ